MTVDEFETACEHSLLPRIGELLHREIADVQETLDIILRELAELERRLDDMTPFNVEDE